MQIAYDYSQVPTIGAFTNSDAFVRALIGPFGSGKSSGCVVEFPYRAQMQRPGLDGVRRTRWAVVRNCFDDQTEILTELRGWQLLRDLMPEDRVATLQNGRDLVYERPSYYYSAHYQGEMIGLRNDAIDMLVTPDHRLYTSKRSTRAKVWQPFGFEKASAVYENTLRRFKRDAVWSGGSALHSEAFFEFLGFWFAEGYAGAYEYRRGTAYRFAVVQRRGLDYVRELIAAAGLRWAERPHGLCVRFDIAVTRDIKPLIRELAALGHAPHKRLPAWIKGAPEGHLRAFLRGYITGDGSFKNGRPKKITTAYTSSPRLADDIQEIALKAGEVVNINRRKVSQGANSHRATTEFCYQMTFLAEARKSPTGRDGWFKCDYDGMVYCLEVSSHVVYVRRGGKAHWSSQTYAELRDTTIQTFHRWLPPQYFGRWYASDHRYVIKAFANCEIEILFRALDRSEDVKKLLSLDLTGAWLNEVREIPWPIVDAVMGRCGRYPPMEENGGPTWSGVWMDTNPPDTDTKFYSFFEERDWLPSFEELVRTGALPPGINRPDDFARIFHQPSGMSPRAENLPNLTPGYYARLGIGKSEAWKKVYIDGDYGFVSDDKVVYSEYRDETHLRPVNPVSGLTIERNWDFGLTPCCTFTQSLPTGQWIVFDELMATDMGIERFSDQVLEHCGRSFRGPVVFDDIGDPAGEARVQTDEKTCFNILHAKGIMIEGGEISETLRLEAMRKPLRMLAGNGEPMFAINPRCRQTRKALLGGYHYRKMPNTANSYTKDPYKNHPFSDLANTLEYRASQKYGSGLTSPFPQDDYPVAPRPMGGRSKVTGY